MCSRFARLCSRLCTPSILGAAPERCTCRAGCRTPSQGEDPLKECTWKQHPPARSRSGAGTSGYGPSSSGLRLVRAEPSKIPGPRAGDDSNAAAGSDVDTAPRGGLSALPVPVRHTCAPSSHPRSHHARLRCRTFKRSDTDNVTDVTTRRCNECDHQRCYRQLLNGWNHQPCDGM